MNSRRKFIQKAIYKTPVLFVLGSLGSSEMLYADASGGPPGPPGGGFGNSNGRGFSGSFLGRTNSKKPRKKLKF